MNLFGLYRVPGFSEALFGSVLSQLLFGAPTAQGGPASQGCPEGTRLVERDHADVLEHDCTDQRGKHCFAYTPGVTRTSGDVTHIRTCMDIYEAPNVRGQKPLVMKSGVEAERFCAAQSKRLCSEAEWESACEGDAHKPWVYGWKADATSCNSGKGWRAFDVTLLNAGGAKAQAEVDRLWQGEGSGARASCVSQDGIYDLVGNVEEWVIARPGRPFRLAMMGGFWAKPWTGCRGTNDAHEPGFKFYEVGFRCCKDPS